MKVQDNLRGLFLIIFKTCGSLGLCLTRHFQLGLFYWVIFLLSPLFFNHMFFHKEEKPSSKGLSRCPTLTTFSPGWSVHYCSGLYRNPNQPEPHPEFL